MAIVSIDLRTGLPKARAVFDHLKPGSCSYVAPCVIGAMVPEEVRARLDDGHDYDSTIGNLILAGLVSAPESQAADMALLQKAFDTGDNFPAVFAELEAKYAQVPA